MSRRPGFCPEGYTIFREFLLLFVKRKSSLVIPRFVTRYFPLGTSTVNRQPKLANPFLLLQTKKRQPPSPSLYTTRHKKKPEWRRALSPRNEATNRGCYRSGRSTLPVIARPQRRPRCVPEKHPNRLGDTAAEVYLVFFPTMPDLHLQASRFPVGPAGVVAGCIPALKNAKCSCAGIKPGAPCQLYPAKPEQLRTEGECIPILPRRFFLHTHKN